MSLPTTLAIILVLAVASTAAAAQALDPVLEPPSFQETDVIASLGPVSLTVADLDARYSVLPEPVAERWAQSPGLIGDEMTKLLLARAIAGDLRAGRLELTIDVEEFERAVRDEALVDAWLRGRRAHPGTGATQEALEAYYAAHADQFSRPRRVDVEHVYVSTVYQSEAAAAQVLRNERAQLESGKDFSMLVQRYGRPENLPFRGGAVTPELTLDTPGIDDSFLAAAVALEEPGELSDIVSSRTGAHLIRLIKAHPAEPLPLEAVADGITQRLLATSLAEAREALLALYGGDLRRAAAALEDTAFGKSPRIQAIMAQAGESALVKAYRDSLKTAVEADVEVLAKERFLAYPERFKTPAVISYRLLVLDREVAAARSELVSGFRESDADLRDYFYDRLAGEVEYTPIFAPIETAQDLPSELADYLAEEDPKFPSRFAIEEEKVVRFIELLEYRGETRQSYESVRDELADELRGSMMGQQWRVFMNRYHQLPLDANPELVGALFTRYGPDFEPIGRPPALDELGAH